MKNGEEIIQEVDYGDILPNGDGTYQTWVSVELDPQSSDIYSCHVEHCGVHTVLQTPQGKDRGHDCPRRLRKRLNRKPCCLPWRGGQIMASPLMLWNGSFKPKVLTLFGPRASLYSYRLLKTPKSFCLCRLYLMLFAILQIKIKHEKIQAHIPLAIRLMSEK